MQRLALAIIVLAIIAGLVAFLFRTASRTLSRSDGVPALSDGSALLPRISFVLLSLVTLYVAFAGGE